MGFAFNSAECRNFDNAIQLEWLCTNGLGGYSSGTVAGANSRKYHGYLVVAARPPVDRFVMLSRVEDHVQIGEGTAAVTHDLSTAEFPDVIHPQGYQNLISFEQKWGPVWRYQFGDVTIQKSITMAHGQDTVLVQYELIGAPAGAHLPVRLFVNPMLAGRDFHGTIQSNYRPSWKIAPASESFDVFLMSTQDCPVKLALSHNADRFTLNPCWWYNFVFRQERMRGYPDRDDLWTPGMLEFTLAPGRPVGFICATAPVPYSKAGEIIADAQRRHAEVPQTLEQADPKNEFLSQLARAADQFIVRRGPAGTAGSSQTSVIAGYHWFEDWGRDTFISLPGLALVTGRFDAARSILDTFADNMRRGLVPNRFPDKATTPEYHTVDAAMWFVQAAYSYWRYSGDGKFLQQYLYPKLCQIMECYRDGTDFGIRMDVDGLIRAGEPHVQLTWMDAKVGDWVVTPRHGKPWEINALWYNNLRIMALVARQANDPGRAGEFTALADLAGANFAEKFWNAGSECLFDAIDDQGNRDPSIRPNQLVAVSLPFSPVPLPMQQKIVATTERLLLTPMGMRTLAPGSLGYHGRCAGDQLARDMAYHQGTVWPWLIGPFVTAYVKVNKNTPQARAAAGRFLETFKRHLRSAGIGSISEIADGDSPFTPRGCIAQAWSVAEVLRSYYEDVLGKAPAWPHEKAPQGALVGA